MDINLNHLRGTLRTNRGCILIYWMFHPMAGMMGWCFCDMGNRSSVVIIGLN